MGNFRDDSSRYSIWTKTYPHSLHRLCIAHNVEVSNEKVDVRQIPSTWWDSFAFNPFLMGSNINDLFLFKWNTLKSHLESCPQATRQSIHQDFWKLCLRDSWILWRSAGWKNSIVVRLSLINLKSYRKYERQVHVWGSWNWQQQQHSMFLYQVASVLWSSLWKYLFQAFRSLISYLFSDIWQLIDFQLRVVKRISELL